jgi:hypothetical protein
MLQFNENGFLRPAKNILVTLAEFENTFVFNWHRQNLYEEYLLYLDDLQNIGLANFTQWIDGSFSTTQSYPKDIDIVTFIDEKDYILYIKECMALKKKYPNLDCYYVQQYSPNHKKWTIGVFDKTEWLFLFGTNRKKQAKGFIELKF